MAKARGDESAAVDETGIGGEHEIGNVWRGVDELHGRSCGDERVDESLPLVVGAVDVRRHLAIHPRIDLVGDGGIVAPAHQVAPPPTAAACRIETGCGAARPEPCAGTPSSAPRRSIPPRGTYPSSTAAAMEPSRGIWLITRK